MKTAKLYQEDVYMKTADGNIMEVIVTPKETLLATDISIFFPEGGGQPSDTGYLNDEFVHHVSEKNGVIYHHVASRTSIKTGETVTMRLDWNNRFKNMQAHLGEHILSGVFHSLFGGVNRGFHMGENYITIDIALENDPKIQEISPDMAMEAERKANEIVWSNHPVTISHFSDSKEAKTLKLRKDLTLEAEDITVVTVGDKDAPKDCVACCGTHPATSSEVGLIKIYKVEKNKGMFRIYFDCGTRAMENFDNLHEVMTRISDRYSAGLEDLEEKLLKEDQKNRNMRVKLSELTRTLALQRAELLSAKASDKKGIIYEKYDDFFPDDILKIEKELTKYPGTLYALLSKKDMTVLLISDGEIKCGNLVKDYANFYGGKGGGKPELARAIFKNETDADLFVDLLEKHLR